MIEQTDALVVLLAFDAAAEDAVRDQEELRAATLRRRAPGQTPSMSEEVDAVRAIEAAAAAGERAGALRALADQVSALRDRAASALGESP